MKVLSRSSLGFCVRITIAVVVLVVGAMAGCSGDDEPMPFLGGGGFGGNNPAEAGPCEDGKARSCSVTLAKQGDVLTCFRGTQTCAGSTWGPCQDGTVTQEAYHPPAPGGSRTQALGPSVDCVGNPCDPFCKAYNETPDGGLTSDVDAGLLFGWRTGSLPSVPTSLTNKALHQPCRSGSDCQFNHRCQDVATPQACGHSKCRTGMGLVDGCDPCVNLICDQDPSCCRTCAHSVCEQGASLTSGCNACVTAVCAARPSCCSTSWNAQCVADVATLCPTAPCGCAADELEFNGKCYTNEDIGNTSWSAARQLCQDRGTGWDLVSIGSQAENDFVRANLTPFEVWIGFTDSANEGTWLWSNGDANTYTNWWRQPDGLDTGGGEGDCVRFDGANGTWDDRACGDTVRAGVCERTGACPGTPAGSTANAGSCYYVLPTNQTWQNARNSCVALGAGWDLATVDSATENAWLTGYITAFAVWIGLNDVTTEGTFVWSSGSTSTYRNWLTIAPDGGDCGYMYAETGDIMDAFWLDDTCSNNKNAFCEGPSQDTGWTQACVDRVKTTCDASCSTADPPSRAGVCAPWLPGQTDTTCMGIDLAVGVPCTGGVVPVCNHGTTEAPAGIKIIHYPAAAAQFPSCTPDTALPGLRNDDDTCVTTAPIPPGQCVNVTCPTLADTNEIMVNPPGAGYQAECSCLDNWSIYSASVACGAPACSGGVSQAIFRRVNMFISFDKSGSMAGTRWNGSVAALTSFFQDPATAGLGVALEYFSLTAGQTVNGISTGDGCASGTSCDPAACANPMIPLATLTAAAAPADTQEDLLIRSLAVGTGGGTPSYPALRGAYDWAIAQQLAAPDEYNVVIFVTDGEPAACFQPTAGGTAASTNVQLAVDAEQMFQNYEIPTYTICMTGANCTALDLIADRGGTSQAAVIDSANTAQVAADLKDALLDIAGQNVSCTFALPNVGGFNPNNASVIYTPGAGATQTLPPQTGAAGCGAGWYYDDPLNPSNITLCPSTCTMIQADQAARIEIGLGCPQLIGSRTITEVYEGVCPAGSGPQWSFLTYDSTVPGDASLLFQLRAANDVDDLAAAPWQDLLTVPTAPAVCTLGGPQPACPVNLYEEMTDDVTQETDARLRFVELAITFNPTSNQRFSPTLNDWRLTYSCQPNQ